MTERLDHLDPATIAALVDRTLDPGARRAAEAHLAECAECREVWFETSEVAEGTGRAGVHTTATTRRVPTRWIYAGASLAASLLIVTAVLQRSSHQRDEVSMALQDFVQAVGTSRFAVARTSLPFEYGAPPSVMRGSQASSASVPVQRAALRLQELNERRPDARTLHGAGLAQLALGNHDRAVHLLESAVEADPAASVDLDLAAALLERWRVLAQPVDATRALHHAELAVRAAPQNPAGRFNRALALEAVGLKERAAEEWREYGRLDPDSPWAAEAAARAARLQGGTRRQTPDRSPMVSAAGPDQGDVRRALCREQAESARLRWQEHYDHADYENAVREGRQRQRYLRCAGLAEVAADAEIGTAEMGLGRIEEARRRLEAVEVAAKDIGDQTAAARAHLALGVLNFREDNIEAGFRRLKEALDVSASSGDAALLVAAHAMLADAYQEQGEPGHTWKHTFEALAALDETVGFRPRYTVLSGAAINARAGGMNGAAWRFADELLRETEHWPNAGGQILAQLERAQAQVEIGSSTDALSDIAKAQELLRLLKEPLRTDFLAEVLAAEGRVLSRSSAAKAISAFSKALEIFEQRGNRVRRAGLLLERGRTHRAAGDLAAAERDWRSGIALVEHERRSISDRELRIARLSHVWDLFDELVRLQLDDPVRALETLEHARFRETSKLPTPTAGSLHQWLPANATALVYAVLPEQLLIWTVRSTGVKLSTRPVAAFRLGRLVDDHNARLQQSRDDHGRELAGLLLPDDILAKPAAQLLIVADGPLHRLSFGSLQLPGARLIQVADVIASPGLRMAAAGATRCPSRVEGRALLVGYGEPSPTQGLPALPGVEAEIARIAELHPRAKVLVGRQASVRAVRESLSSASLFHFAGHAVSDLAVPARSRLVLPSSGVDGAELTGGAIGSMRLRARPLVILPACETALGRVFRGEGAVSLSTPFLSAGASAVVSTLWRVTDDDAEWMMTRFHHLLSAGRDAAAALAEVQRAAAAQGRPAHTWSGFVYYGTLTKGLPECQN